MAKLIVEKEIFNEYIRYGEDFECDGVKYTIEDELAVDMDDNGKTRTYIYKNEDNKFYKTYVTFARYGYEDYGYEDYMNDPELFEVELKEQIIKKWVSVN